jgi:16S rRNA (guanine966-N2)-methyltransferase
MRITGGQARGIILKTPSSETTRPATAYLREAIFSSLALDWEGVSFLDLFAGTGSFGLEAYSRGASKGVFVEMDFKVITLLKENIAKVDKCLGKTLLNSGCEAVKADAIKWGINTPHQYDVILAGPPYKLWATLDESWLSKVGTHLLKKETSRLVIEAPGEKEFGLIDGLECIRRLGKGKRQPSALIFKPTLA